MFNKYYAFTVLLSYYHVILFFADGNNNLGSNETLKSPAEKDCECSLATFNGVEGFSIITSNDELLNVKHQYYNKKHLNSFNKYLNSERSDEFIDFTMMCVFFIFFIFVSAVTSWSSKSASIFRLSPVSDRKVNLVGTLRGQNVRKNPKKVTEK
ncbi:Uncharacterized protein FWK35_00013745 [Aphis craccivora]|uniref:Uncharacterized protein n=1 Tax=Aphis craccivora TaxID=307492 RepID=A0A6G0YA50_APHCR|nr:Uncharacterized protein FWK35_00013745 [Aphis craccivora]